MLELAEWGLFVHILQSCNDVLGPPHIIMPSFCLNTHLAIASTCIWLMLLQSADLVVMHTCHTCCVNYKTFKLVQKLWPSLCLAISTAIAIANYCVVILTIVGNLNISLDPWLILCFLKSLSRQYWPQWLNYSSSASQFAKRTLLHTWECCSTAMMMLPWSSSRRSTLGNSWRRLTISKTRTCSLLATWTSENIICTIGLPGSDGTCE